MSNILVTGGAGNIGSALAKKLAETPDNFIVVADDLSTGKRENLPFRQTNVKFVKCDANDFQDISCLFFAHHFVYLLL